MGETAYLLSILVGKSPLISGKEYGGNAKRKKAPSPFKGKKKTAKLWTKPTPIKKKTGLSGKKKLFWGHKKTKGCLLSRGGKGEF